MSKYTPSPWAPAVSSQPYWYVDGPGGIVAITSQENAEGNARLIATAPEMLEAIKAMMPFWCPDERAPDCKIGVRQILDLIAKAEGRL